ARVRLGRRTMLQVITDIAKKTNRRVRTLRRDLVPRSGPLGGIYSGLKTTKADALVFLACDMPFVTKEVIDRLIATAAAHPGQAVFFALRERLGFPLMLLRPHAKTVALCLKENDLSIQSLGERLSA